MGASDSAARGKRTATPRRASIPPAQSGPRRASRPHDRLHDESLTWPPASRDARDPEKPPLEAFATILKQTRPRAPHGLRPASYISGDCPAKELLQGRPDVLPHAAGDQRASTPTGAGTARRPLRALREPYFADHRGQGLRGIRGADAGTAEAGAGRRGGVGKQPARRTRDRRQRSHL